MEIMGVWTPARIPFSKFSPNPPTQPVTLSCHEKGIFSWLLRWSLLTQKEGDWGSPPKNSVLRSQMRRMFMNLSESVWIHMNQYEPKKSLWTYLNRYQSICIYVNSWWFLPHLLSKKDFQPSHFSSRKTPAMYITSCQHLIDKEALWPITCKASREAVSKAGKMMYTVAKSTFFSPKSWSWMVQMIFPDFNEGCDF